MIKSQKNRFTMYDAVTSYLDENSSKFSANEEFIDHFAAFKSAINDISKKEDLRSKATTGKTLDKNVTRSSVINEALAVSGAIYAYAKKSGNITLMESMNFTRTKLGRFRDTGLVIELNSIKEKAIEYSEPISRYGITGEKITQFDDNITAYDNALSAKAAGGPTRSGASKSLVTLFNDAGSILDSIDKLMENYLVTETGFYEGYKAARVIKDLGLRHKADPDMQAAPENK